MKFFDACKRLNPFFCLFFILPLFLFSGLPSTAGQDHPNLIFILVDDMGWGDVGFNGQQEIKTPRLDRLAKEGLVFNQFYAGCTVCAPSRATFLTGFHTGHVWQRYNGNIQFREDPYDLTIGTMLKRAGYQTAMIGKSGLACNSDDAGLPNRKGFDYFYGYLAHAAAHRFFPKTLVRNGEIVEYPGNHGRTGDQYSGDLVLAETLGWLDQNGEKGPFFLHLSLQQPHADLVAPEEFVAPYRGRFHEKPFTPQGPNQGYRQVDQPAATYAGMVTYVDHSIGKVIDKLIELGIEENTLVIFSSDNGGPAPGTATMNTPLRAGKGTIYEGGIRVCAFATWPGKIPAGITVDEPLHGVDWYPTLVKLAAAPAGQDLPLDGLDIWPVLTAGAKSPHDALLLAGTRPGVAHPPQGQCRPRRGHGRPRRRRGNLWLRQGDLGRFGRHQDGNGPRPRHGDGVGHVGQTRPAALWRRPGRGVPRPLDDAAQYPHVERHAKGHRRRDQALRR